MDHGDRLRDHFTDRGAGRPGATGPLATRALGHRSPALGPRRDLRRGPLPDPDQQRPADHGRPAQPRHHRTTPGRGHQHRRLATPPRPRPTSPARHLQDRLTTLPRPWTGQRPAFDPDGHPALVGHGFRLERVFRYEDTEGEPLPEAPEVGYVTGDTPAGAWEALAALV